MDTCETTGLSAAHILHRARWTLVRAGMGTRRILARLLPAAGERRGSRSWRERLAWRRKEETSEPEQEQYLYGESVFGWRYLEGTRDEPGE